MLAGRTRGAGVLRSCTRACACMHVLPSARCMFVRREIGVASGNWWAGEVAMGRPVAKKGEGFLSTLSWSFGGLELVMEGRYLCGLRA